MTLDLSARTHVMGIVNMTPDSFSDGGKFVAGPGKVPDAGRAVDEALKMADDGADILDVGGESTRPGAQRVSVEEELGRVIPVIEALSSATDTPISIDTCKASVAKEAIGAGASMVNDISAMSFDPDMAGVVAGSGAAVVLMHIKGTPADMQKDPRYGDLLGEVTEFLTSAAAKALEAGVGPRRILLDPGIGFGKRPEHNLELIRRLGEICELGYPVVLGASRKAFIGLLTDGAPPHDRLEGSLTAAVLGATMGASIVRVHDVKATRRALAVADAVNRSG